MGFPGWGLGPKPAGWEAGWSLAPLECFSQPLPSKTKFALKLWTKAGKLLCKHGGAELVGCSHLLGLLKNLGCHFQLPPALVLLAIIACAALTFLAVVTALTRCLRWYSAKRGSAFVAVAASAARDLRASNPELYPKAKHSWVQCPSLVDMAPICSICFKPTTAQEAMVCEMCGSVAHAQGCVRHAVRDCKPICVVSDHPTHDWRPAGTVLSLKDFPSPVECENPELDFLVGQEEGDGMSFTLCVLCNQPCEDGLFSVEPVWTCSCCHHMAHVRCFVEQQPDIISASTKAALVSQLQSMQEEQAFDEGNVFASLSSPRSSVLLLNACDEGGLALANKGTGWLNLSSFSRTSGDGAAMEKGKGFSCKASCSCSGIEAVTDYPSGSPPSSETLQTLPPSASPSKSKGHGRRSSPGRGPKSNGPKPTLERAHLQQPVLSNGAPFASSLKPNECRLGLSRGISLPNTVFQRTRKTKPAEGNMGLLKGNSWRGANDSGASDSESGAVSYTHKKASSSGHACGATCISSPSNITSASSTSRAKDARWWPRKTKPSRWEPYEIDTGKIARSWRPLLVFINTKSGPQAGLSLKLQLLQLLHPLQVVELPKEKPEPALRCFLRVPNLRVLVVGGDGTVGWILMELDKLLEETQKTQVETDPKGTLNQSRAPLPPSFRFPPVAVMPMGTGNDLARCLNWGGGYGAVRQTSLLTFLLNVSKATVTNMDRWDVEVLKHVKASRLKRPWVFGKGGKGAAAKTHTQAIAGAETDSQPASPFTQVGSRPLQSLSSRQTSSVKPDRKLVLNNYLGIGIDAKVALEFHHMRDSFPSLFKSQVGNKMWYTGVGAGDLVWRSCINIAERLQIVCDGVELQIPTDAQGVVIMNIYCHMGGVFMWAHGIPAEPLPGGEALTRYREQSMSDGLLEVVAIGGVAHMGRLAVGLARAQRLCQCKRISITTHKPLPMQVDGEPWMQAPGELHISMRGRGMMLRKVAADSKVARAATLVNDVLESGAQTGFITESQRQWLASEMAARLEPLL